MAKLGELAFIVGTVIAFVIGVLAKTTFMSAAAEGWLILVLVVLGLVVGLLNITEKESMLFLIAAAALLLTGTVGPILSVIPTIGVYMQGIVQSIAVFVTPAAIVVALKTIKSLAKD